MNVIGISGLHTLSPSSGSTSSIWARTARHGAGARLHRRSGLRPGGRRPCRAFANLTDLGGHERTRSDRVSSTGGHVRSRQETGGHAGESVRDRTSEGGIDPDSQADSHSVGHRQPSADVTGSQHLTLHLARTSLDTGGRQKRGLQNRLRGAAEASWVGSIPIHPRQISWL